MKKTISAKMIKISKSFLCKDKHCIIVVLVPSFHASAISSSVFLVFWLHFSGSIFFWTGVIYCWHLDPLKVFLKIYLFAINHHSLIVLSQKNYESWSPCGPDPRSPDLGCPFVSSLTHDLPHFELTIKSSIINLPRSGRLSRVFHVPL